ncbi:MAG: sulfatase-like hydrolase/transferase [Kiritimatiellia bacterium]
MASSAPSADRVPTGPALWLASALLATTLLLFVPLRLFLGNFYEFTITFPRLLIYLAALAVAGTAALALIVRLAPRRARHGLWLAVFALGALAWLQSALNPGDFGVLNGQAIDWASPANRRALAIEAVLWLGGLGLVFGLRRRLAPHVGRISAILLATQLVGVVHLSATTLSSAATPWWNQHALDTQDKFAFSAGRNAIVLVLDTFQTTLFQQLRDENPELFACLDGFTFYPDTVGGFPVTQPSIPVILTGAYYDNSVPYVDFVKERFDGPALPTVLKRAGFRSETYPMVPITVYLTPESADNLKKNRFRMDWKRDRELLARLLDPAWFQAAPQPLKKRIFADNHWFLQNRIGRTKSASASAPAKRRNKDVLFIEEMEAKACVRPGPPAFKFYHLNGIHAPLNLNENLEAEDMPEKRGSYRRQAIAMLKIVDRFLAKLKAIGAYDDALVVIAADHGFGPIGIYDPARGQRPDDDFYRNDLFMGGALALLLVKPVGARGELQTSAVQATLADIPATVCAELGVAAPFDGLAVTQAVPSETPRRRRWHTFTWSWLSGNDYLPPLREFHVEGPGWQEESWRPTRTTYEPGRVVRVVPEPVALGTVLAFDRRQNGLPYLELGWGEEHRGLVWSTHSYASLGVPLQDAEGDLQLVFRWLPFLVPARVEAQEIAIYVNDRHLQDVRLTRAELQECRVDVPRDWLAGSFLKIAFRIPGAVSPASVGAGADQRTLGVALKSLEIAAK